MHVLRAHLLRQDYLSQMRNQNIQLKFDPLSLPVFVLQSCYPSVNKPISVQISHLYAYSLQSDAQNQMQYHLACPLYPTIKTEYSLIDDTYSVPDEQSACHPQMCPLTESETLLCQMKTYTWQCSIQSDRRHRNLQTNFLSDYSLPLDACSLNIVLPVGGINLS